MHSFAVRFEFFVLVVTSFPEIDGNLQQRSQDIEIEIFEFGFQLDALDTVVVIDVLELVTENIGELVFAHHQVEHAFADVDQPAGKREGVDHVVIGENGELVGQAAMRVERHGVPDAGDVSFEAFFFRRELARLRPYSKWRWPRRDWTWGGVGSNRARRARSPG